RVHDGGMIRAGADREALGIGHSMSGVETSPMPKVVASRAGTFRSAITRPWFVASPPDLPGLACSAARSLARSVTPGSHPAPVPDSSCPESYGRIFPRKDAQARSAP